MPDWTRSIVWTLVFTVLVVGAVPWFLWGDATVVAGLPAWLWYHVAWLCLTAAAFYVFTQTDWGLFVEEAP